MNYLQNIEKKNYTPIFILLILIFSYFTFAACIRYFNFRIYWDSLSIIKVFDVILGNDISANTLYLSGYDGERLFFDHLYFSSLIYLPFYFIIRHPLVILVLQCFFVTISAGLFAHLAIKKGLKVWTVTTLLFVFLCHPTIQGSTIRTGNITNLAIFFLSLMFWSFYLQKRKIYFTACVLLMLTREDMGIIILLFNVIIMLKTKEYKKYMPHCLAAIIYTLAAILYIIPYLNEGRMEHLQLHNYYRHLGNSYFDIIKNLPQNLSFFIIRFTSKDFLFINFIFFAPFLFLPLLRFWYFIPVLPLITMNIISLFYVNYC